MYIAIHNYMYSAVRRAEGGHVGRGDGGGGCTTKFVEIRLYNHLYKEDIRLNQADIQVNLSTDIYTTIDTTILPFVQIYNYIYGGVNRAGRGHVGRGDGGGGRDLRG